MIRACLLALLPLARTLAADPSSIPSGATADAVMVHGVQIAGAGAPSQEVMLDLGPVEFPRPDAAPLVLLSGARAHARLRLDAALARIFISIDRVSWVGEDGQVKELATHGYAIERGASPLPGLPLVDPDAVPGPPITDADHTHQLAIAARHLTILFAPGDADAASGGRKGAANAAGAVVHEPLLIIAAATTLTELTITRPTIDGRRTDLVNVEAQLPTQAPGGQPPVVQSIHFDATAILMASGRLGVRLTRAALTLPDGRPVAGPAEGWLLDPASGDAGIPGLAESLGYKPRTRGAQLAAFPVTAQLTLVLRTAVDLSE